MREFRNLKQVVCDPGHQNACPVFVKIGETQAFNVREHIFPHVCLDQDAHSVSKDRDDIIEKTLQNISGKQNCDDNEKSSEEFRRKQNLHGTPGNNRKDQIDDGKQAGTDHIYGEKLPVRTEIGEKNRK